jgi:hypothetical protein
MKLGDLVTLNQCLEKFSPNRIIRDFAFDTAVLIESVWIQRHETSLTSASFNTSMSNRVGPTQAMQTLYALLLKG